MGQAPKFLPSSCVLGNAHVQRSVDDGSEAGGMFNAQCTTGGDASVRDPNPVLESRAYLGKIVSGFEQFGVIRHVKHG